MKEFRYFIPTKVHFGFGAIKKLHEDLPGKKALIVSTQGGSIRRNGSLDKLIEELEKASVSYLLYDKVKANPSLENVREGSEIARKEGCDFVIGLGGGSAMDCSKAIAIMANNEGDYWDYQGGKTGKNMPIPNDPLPIVCITTTAGTGSEVDPWLVISKEETKEKLGFGYDKTYPYLSIVDPDFMMTVPPKFTVYQGFDAFFHAVESVINRFENPMGEMFAIKAVEYISKYLPRAYKDGMDREARYYLALANSLAGYFMLTTSEHTFEHSLSAVKTEVAHGAGLIAISDAYHSFFVKKKVCEEAYIKLAKAMGKEDSLRGEDFLDCMRDLKDKCHVKDLNITSLGFTMDDIEELTDLTYELRGRKLKMDPIELSRDEIRDIIKKSL